MTECVTLSQMVDLALGTPELGAVNFNVLHSLFHAVLQKLDLADVKADIDKADSDFLAQKRAETPQNLLPSDAAGGKDGSDGAVKDGESGIGTDAESVISKDQPESEKKQAAEDTAKAGTKNKKDSDDSPVFSKRSPYHKLQDQVKDLQKQMEELSALPSNEELFDRMKAKGDTTDQQKRPVTDMWQNMQLSKKVAANEEGVGKLMSLVQDLMTEVQKLTDDNEKLKKDLENLPKSAPAPVVVTKDAEPIQLDHLAKASDLDELRKKLKDLEDLTNEMKNNLPAPGSGDFDTSDFVTWSGLEDSLRGIRDQLMPQETQPQRVVIEMSSQTEAPSQASRPQSRMSSRMSTPGPSAELQEILERLGKLCDQHDVLEQRVSDVEEQLKNKADKDSLEGLGVSDDLLQQLKDLEEQLENLKKAKDKDTDALNRMQHSIQQLQAELERLSNTTQKLIDDNDSKQKKIETLFAICNKLEENKADKEFVQNEVDVKADKRHLDGKVNRSLFDTTCDELSKMINDILCKLSGHDEDWKKALGQLTDDLDGKLDRLEFGPIRDELERQLRALAKKLGQVHYPVEPDEDDAAGIRRQLVQKFNCISCDRPVDMAPQGPIPSIPAPAGLPATRSSRPYTTFELEQIRQHAKARKQRPYSSCSNSGNAGKNMINFKRAILERQVARCRMQSSFRALLWHIGNHPQLQTLKTGVDMTGQPQIDVMELYGTTRACGGTHTLTYPHRRITRMATVNTLFREDDVPTYRNETDIQGADGHVYKGRAQGADGTKLPELAAGQGASRSPKPIRRSQTAVSPSPHRPGNPVSSTHRPNSARLVRPQSARDNSRPQSAAGRQQGTPVPAAEIPTGGNSYSPQPPPAPAPSEPGEVVEPVLLPTEQNNVQPQEQEAQS